MGRLQTNEGNQIYLLYVYLFIQIRFVLMKLPKNYLSNNSILIKFAISSVQQLLIIQLFHCKKKIIIDQKVSNIKIKQIMSTENNQNKSDSDFEELTTTRMASFLKEVHQEIDQTDVTYDDLCEEKEVLSQKVAVLVKENCGLGERVREMEREVEQLVGEQKMTEKLWRQESEKLKEAQSKISQLTSALNQQSLPTQPQQSSNQTHQLQQQLDKVTLQNAQLSQQLLTLKKLMQQEKHTIQSQVSIIRVMLEERQKEVNELRLKLEEHENEGVPHRMNMLDSMEQVDFVLSRDPSYANDGESPSNSPTSNTSNRLGDNTRYQSEPWVMRESYTTSTLGESFTKCLKQADKIQPHTLKLQSQLFQANIENSELTQKLEKVEKDLEKMKQELMSKVKTIEQFEEKSQQIKEQYKNEVNFYMSQVQNVNEMYKLQQQRNQQLKSNNTQLQQQLNQLIHENKKLQKTKTSSQITPKPQQPPIIDQQLQAHQLQSQMIINQLQHELKLIKDKLLRAEEGLRELEGQKLRLEGEVEKMRGGEGKYISEVDDVRRQLLGKEQQIKGLEELVMTSEVKHKQQINNKDVEIQQLKKELSLRSQQLENAKNLTNGQNDLREQLLSQIQQKQQLQEQKALIQLNYTQLLHKQKFLQKQFRTLQIERDSLMKKNEKINLAIDKADKYYQNEFNKVQAQKQHLRQLVKKVQKQTKLQTKHLKQLHLNKTQQLNQQIATLNSQLFSLNQLMTKYEHPRNNMERFQLVKKWFDANHWAKDEKCEFMNWLEEFFKMYVMSSLGFGDDAMEFVEERQW